MKNIHSNVILNFTEEDFKVLAQPIGNKNKSATILYIEYKKLTDSDCKAITKTDATTKFHIILHGMGLDKVGVGHYKDFCKIVTNLLAHLKIDPDKFNADSPKPTISLICCFAAMPRTTTLDSLAGRIHFELAKNNMYVNILARPSVVTIHKKLGIKQTSKLSLNNKIHFFFETGKSAVAETKKIIHKQPHSKILLTWEAEKVQAAYDAYAVKEFRRGKATKKPDPLQTANFDKLEELYKTSSAELKSRMLSEKARTKEEKIEKFSTSLREIWGQLDQEYNSIGTFSSLFSSKKDDLREEIMSIYSIYSALDNRETPPSTYLKKHNEYYKQAVSLLADSDTSGIGKTPS